MKKNISFEEEQVSINSEEESHSGAMDAEWHARHGVRTSNFSWRKPFGIGVFIVINLIVSVTGGVFGFVALSTGDSQVAQRVRSALHLGTSEVRVPVRQDVLVQESSAFIDAAKKVEPAVVSISANVQVSDFFGRTSTQTAGAGSGFILTSDGLIVTNRHVVEQQGASFKVILDDGRIFDGTVKAVDTLNDLAVIKIDAKDLPSVELGSSDALKVGQFVLAVGNALGEFKNSVSLGIVSAKGRELNNVGGGNGAEDLSELIQTDASINPGNSGGPLVNSAGQVVGINTAIASPTGSSVGVGFAISIDSVRTVLDSIRKTGEIIRPYLGVRYLPINKTIQRLNSLSVDYGVLVLRGTTVGQVAVSPGSPADKAGILENDIILEIAGEKIDENNSLQKRLAKHSVGEKLDVKILRKGEEKTVSVTLERQPK